MATNVYNLIILDESGSMDSIKAQAIDGVNTTLDSIRQSQLENANQEHYVTLVTFDSSRINTIFKALHISKVRSITSKDYNPNAFTPLYDAMGESLTELRSTVKDGDIVLVTIITDGYENASQKYSRKSIKELVDELTKMDWVFAYIGANQDVYEVSESLGIKNTMSFDLDAEGVSDMFLSNAHFGGQMMRACENIECDSSLSENEKREKKRAFITDLFSM